MAYSSRGRLRGDTAGEPTGAINWTGEVQAIAFTDTAAATAVSVPGNDFLLVATQACHIVFGTTRMKAAHATNKGVCFFLPANTYLPVFVSDIFKFNTGDDPTTVEPGTLYVGIVRATANGTLYITEMIGNEGCRGEGATSTTSSTTTTSTSTTSTTTTTVTTTTTSTTTTT